MELPKVYKESWRTVFNADASVVDLHKLGPYYYGFGSQLLNFDNPENTELAQSILQVKGLLLAAYNLHYYLKLVIATHSSRLCFPCK